MFYGTHQRSIDAKWRLALPQEIFDPKFEGDRETFYFLPAGDHLILMSSAHFHRLSEQLTSKNVMARRKLRRKLFGKTYVKQIDKNGRIQVPLPLRHLCGLAAGATVDIIGTGPYAEIRAQDAADLGEESEEMFAVFDELEAMEE
jgi:DNA-binding transcriptional regulator/RsmH inhibitor MraZ